MSRHIGDLPHALEDGDQLARHLAGRRPAVFLDYDGTLTPIVARPEDALISESMRDAVRGLAGRCPVCVVSGRDRRGMRLYEERTRANNRGSRPGERREL